MFTESVLALSIAQHSMDILMISLVPQTPILSAWYTNEPTLGHGNRVIEDPLFVLLEKVHCILYKQTQ